MSTHLLASFNLSCTYLHFSSLFISAWLSVRYTHAYTVPAAGTSPIFPVQQPNPVDAHSFLRVIGDTVETISCPRGFVFSDAELKCVATTATMSRSASQTKELSTPECPSGLRGLWPNQYNCRTFLNCWDGTGYEMNCTSYLLFSFENRNCEWPETSGCCEYVEKNSSRLVQSV